MGLRVVSFESRREIEMAELLRRHGAEPVRAPSMREIPLEENSAAQELVRRLLANEIDVLILLTGIGTRVLLAAAVAECSRQRLVEALARIVTVARGPKPAAALRELGVTPSVRIEEPNTWREILVATEKAVPVAGRQVAVQEYGVSNAELIDGLSARGARILSVPVYRWALPLDTAPLRAAVRALAAGTIDIALFTSATQGEHVMWIARDEHVEQSLMSKIQRVVVASIGPVCSGKLRTLGFPVDLEPRHPKMGQLVREVADLGPALVAGKRGQGS